MRSDVDPVALYAARMTGAFGTKSGAPLASTRTIDVKVGAAVKQGKRLLSYGTMPKRCPKGGFPVKSELIFGGAYGGEREFGIPAERVTVTSKAPCPREHRKRH